MNKTQYRLFPLKWPYLTERQEMVLQFKSTRFVRVRWFGPKEEVEYWRCVPDHFYGACTGKYLFEEDCPPMPGTHGFKTCRFDDLYQMKSFAATWPDIREYFKALRHQREVYVASEITKKQIAKVKTVAATETIYL